MNTFTFAAYQRAVSQRSSMPGKHMTLQDCMAIHTETQTQILQLKKYFEFERSHVGGCVWLSVADGVSSSPHAALASRTFLEILHGQTPSQHSRKHGAQALAPAALPEAVRSARDEWRSRYLRPQTEGAATTLASVMLQGDTVCAVNCGDSRIWRIRGQADGTVRWLQISHDHTVWQQMLDAGEVTEGERSDYASVYQGLLHCLVLGNDSVPDLADDEDDDLADYAPPENWLHTWHGKTQTGDIFILATDGLHETLGDATIQSLWQPGSDITQNLRTLEEAFLKAGAPDDCSVIACQVE